jgi:hypothetical protein
MPAEPVVNIFLVDDNEINLLLMEVVLKKDKFAFCKLSSRRNLCAYYLKALLLKAGQLLLTGLMILIP